MGWSIGSVLGGDSSNFFSPGPLFVLDDSCDCHAWCMTRAVRSTCNRRTWMCFITKIFRVRAPALVYMCGLCFQPVCLYMSARAFSLKCSVYVGLLSRASTQVAVT